MNVYSIVIFSSILFLSLSSEAASKLCYVKRGIEDGSLSVRSSPRVVDNDLLNGKSNEVALLFELTPVPCELTGKWSKIPGRDSKGKPKDFFFRDAAKYFEKEDVKVVARANLEPNKYLAVYNQVGQTRKSCAASPGCKAVAWPDRYSKIDVLSAFIDWDDDETRYEIYYNVRVRYERNCTDPKTKEMRICPQDKMAWMKARHLVFYEDNRTSPEEPVTPTSPAEPPLLVNLAKPPVLMFAPKVEENDDFYPEEDIEETARPIEPLQSLSVDEKVTQAFNALSPLLGECLLNPDGPPKKIIVGSGKRKREKTLRPKMLLPKSNGYSLPFDDYVMAGYWDKIKHRISPVRVVNEFNERPDLSKVIAIDTLARTIYGEMAICAYKPSWEKYLQAVARVSHNRVLAINSENRQVRTEANARFVHSRSDRNFRDLKDDMTRVLIEPYAYSVWNPTNEAHPSNLKQVLCPPAQRNKRIWNGEDITKKNRHDLFERSIWDHALRYSIEAILYTKEFEKRTQGMDAHYYTSNFKMKGGKLLSRQEIHMNGFRDFDKYCIQLWRENKTHL